MKLPVLLAAFAAFTLQATAALAQDPSASQAPFKQPIFKCPGKDGVVYTHVPCGGGKTVGEKQAKSASRAEVPPQDRARQHARAQLPAETREQCEALEVQIQEGEAKVRAMNALPAEEGQLAMKRVRYRELRC